MGGTPYNLYDALRGTGSLIGRAAQGAGRMALGAGRGILKYGVGDFGAEPEAVPPAPVPDLSRIARAAGLQEPPPPPPINDAAIRSSNARAKYLAPGLDTSMESPLPEPTSMGSYVSPMQRAQNRSVAARGAFDAGPEWKGEGGGLRSAAQMEQDLRAHDLLNQGYRQNVEQIGVEDQVRGNPMERQIQGRQKTLELENLMPEYSGVDAQGNPIPYEPSMQYDTGHGRRIFRQANAPTGPTVGEMSALQRSLALKRAGQNPKDMLAVAQDQDRQGEVGKLMAAKKLYDRDVAQGKRTREDAEAEFEAAVLEAAKRGALREGDFSALARLIYPSPDLATMMAFGGGGGAAGAGQGR